jgi:hypothetical protein
MSYYEKYLKYKHKYLELKNKVNLIGNGEDECIVCKKTDIWIYKKNPTICEDCYKKQHELVKQYHSLQDLAFENIKKGNIKKAVENLTECRKLRNTHMTEYFNDGNKGHNHFANVFLPELIKELNKENMTKEQALSIWANKFSELDNSD